MEGMMRIVQSIAFWMLICSIAVTASTGCQTFSTIPRAPPGGLVDQGFVPGDLVGAGFISPNEIAIATNNDEKVKTLVQVVSSTDGALLREWILDLASFQITTCLKTGLMAFATIGQTFTNGEMLLQTFFHQADGTPAGYIGRTTKFYNFPTRFSPDCSRLMLEYDDGTTVIFNLNQPGHPALNTIYTRGSPVFGMINNQQMYVMWNPNRLTRRFNLLKPKGAVIQQFWLSNNPLDFAADPSGKRLFVGGQRGSVAAKDYMTADGKKRIYVDVDPLDQQTLQVAGSPSGQHFAGMYARQDQAKNIIKVFDVVYGQLEMSLGQMLVPAFNTTWIQFSSDGTSLLMVGDNASKSIRVCPLTVVSIPPTPAPTRRRHRKKKHRRQG